MTQHDDSEKSVEKIHKMLKDVLEQVSETKQNPTGIIGTMSLSRFASGIALGLSKQSNEIQAKSAEVLKRVASHITEFATGIGKGDDASHFIGNLPVILMLCGLENIEISARAAGKEEAIKLLLPFVRAFEGKRFHIGSKEDVEELDAKLKASGADVIYKSDTDETQRRDGGGNNRLN